MGVIPLLVICSVLVAASFLIAFIIASRKGQYDDLQTPSMRMVFDDVANSQNQHKQE